MDRVSDLVYISAVHLEYAMSQVADFPGKLPPPVLASYGGCLTARTAAAAAFAKKGRSMLAADVIEELGAAVDNLYDHE